MNAVLQALPVPTMAEERSISPRELKLLAEPTREFLFHALIEQARTAAELAELLKCPSTRLYHHLKLLEQAGLIVVVAQRLVSGIVERRYRAVARRVRLDRAAFGAASDEGVHSVLSYAFDQARSDIEHAVANGRIDMTQRPPHPQALMAFRSVLKLTPAQQAELRERLLALHLEFEQRATEASTDPSADFLGVVIATFPTELRASETPVARGARTPVLKRRLGPRT